MSSMQPQGWWAHPARAIVAVEADRDQERDGRDGEHAHDRPPPLDFPACVRDALSATLYFARARALLTISAWASPCWRCPEGHPPGRASRPSQCHRRRRAAACALEGAPSWRAGTSAKQADAWARTIGAASVVVCLSSAGLPPTSRLNARGYSDGAPSDSTPSRAKKNTRADGVLHGGPHSPPWGFEPPWEPPWGAVGVNGADRPR